ncbi:MAG: hypothetical protein FVQ80_07135 [Planctomycetes bacterium]|nr:hypothetical protein [Planctomycetota bacterium]
MLSKKDKNGIRKIIREEIQLAFRDGFKRKLIMEIAPRKPGDPPKHTKEMDVNVLDELVKYLPYIEGAIRGCQEDTDKALIQSTETKKEVTDFVALLTKAIAENKSLLLIQEGDFSELG